MSEYIILVHDGRWEGDGVIYKENATKAFMMLSEIQEYIEAPTILDMHDKAQISLFKAEEVDLKFLLLDLGGGKAR